MAEEGLLLHLDDESFNRVVKTKDLIMVDFWAPWCSPCLAMAPAIEELAQEYEGRVTVGKLNVDENPATAERYGITGIPSVLFFRNGKLADTMTGLVPKDRLEETLRMVLSI